MRDENAGTSRRGNRRRGAATVEFAVIAPLFLLLLAGIIEFGLAFRIQHTLSSAARRGARAAVVEGISTSMLTADIKTHCARLLGVHAEDVAVTVTINGSANGDLTHAESGDAIGVTVAVPYSKAGVGFFANTFATSTLTSTCTFERE